MTLVLFGAMAIIGASLILILDNQGSINNVLAGLCGIGLSSLWALILGRQLFDRRPVLIIDQQGFWDRRIGRNPVPWSKIAGVTASNLLGLCSFAVTLNQPVSDLDLTWEHRVLRKLIWLSNPFCPNSPNSLDCPLVGLKVSREQMQAAFDQTAPFRDGQG